ncbi:hypothetical protein KI387_008270, partial [Taxus chinensis]
SDDGEVPDPTGALEITVEEEKEVLSTKPPSIIDSSAKEALDASFISLLEATM